MQFSYDWIADYLEDPPSIEVMSRLLNETGLETEVVDGALEIEHTVNRPDAMNHFGLAREIAVKQGKQPVMPAIFEGDLPKSESWKITSENADDCWRYLLLEVTGVEASESPGWLKQRLDEIDQTSHNLLVDLTNYLLWEFGHPSHAFDSDKLTGRHIHVRFGRKGERLTTLDGRDHGVEGHVCITDENGPIALGGIMGGENTEVDDATKNLVLELAVFQPKRVRLSGRSLGIESDARHRFERGIDEEAMERIIRRFVHLLLESQPGAKVQGLAEMNLKPFSRAVVPLRKKRMDKLLGIELDVDRVSNLLTAMDFQPEKTGDGWKVRVPGYKVDVAREVDVIEEVIRFAGLDLLESTLPRMTGSDYRLTALSRGKAVIHKTLTGLGFQETCTYSFLARDLEARFGQGTEPVPVRNPMSENQAVLRRSLLPNMLECVRRNHNRGIPMVAFYEVGRVFHGDNEHQNLAVIVSDSGERDRWYETPQVHPFYRVKGLLETLSEKWDWRALKLIRKESEPLPLDFCLGLYHGDEQIGYIGILNAAENQFWDFAHPVAVLEMDLRFIEELDGQAVKVQTIPEFPGMKIDMAFVLDQHHHFADLKAHILALKPQNLQDMELFDVYQGKAVGKGKKSLGLRFRFQNPSKTLTGDEVSTTMAAVVESVKTKFGAEIRE